jgi:ADP-ribose pyrophosphatase YjhB (NUDIX family)
VSAMPEPGPTPAGWIDAETWRRIQAVVPIVGVDVLPIRRGPGSEGASGRTEAVGLILRDTPQGSRRWCLIGGRLRYGESVSAAIARPVRETLGRAVRCTLPPRPQPLYVAQYAPSDTAPPEFDASDPRQHAIGLTYALELVGSAVPSGEAYAFEWFPADRLPAPERFGFHQDRVVAACIERLRVA